MRGECGGDAGVMTMMVMLCGRSYRRSAAGKAGPAPEVMERRRRWERFAARMYAVLVIVTMAVAVPVSGWVWWNRPIPRSVARPAGVEEGKMMWMDDSIPPVRTTSGVALSAEDLQSRNREWIALVRWEDPKILQVRRSTNCV